MALRALPGSGPALGKYELLERLAVGGMGEVFLARERGAFGVNRLVVVKQLLPEMADRPDLIELFVHEARVWAHLSHANIVRVHEFGQQDGVHFLAMEYVPGQNLSRIRERSAIKQKRIERDHGLYIMLQIARALDYAHNAKDDQGQPLGIVHRDVSPHNVLVSFQGDVKLTDFGIARSSSKVQRTETGVIRGKVSYMAPEQLAGTRVDARADVYSCGVMLWELTLGERLFDGDNLEARLMTAREVPAPRTRDPAYPEELEEIVMGALAADADRRTASAAQLASDLRAHLQRSGAQVDAEALGQVVRDLFQTENARFEQLNEERPDQEGSTLSQQLTEARLPELTEGALRPPPKAVHPPQTKWGIAAAIPVLLLAIWVSMKLLKHEPAAAPTPQQVTAEKPVSASPAPSPADPSPPPSHAPASTPAKKRARAAAPPAKRVGTPKGPVNPLDKPFDF